MQKGMTEKQVIDLLGEPSKAEVKTCGAGLGPGGAWSCKLWSYGASSDGMNVLFSEENGEWLVNRSWAVH